MVFESHSYGIGKYRNGSVQHLYIFASTKEKLIVKRILLDVAVDLLAQYCKNLQCDTKFLHYSTNLYSILGHFNQVGIFYSIF